MKPQLLETRKRNSDSTSSNLCDEFFQAPAIEVNDNRELVVFQTPQIRPVPRHTAEIMPTFLVEEHHRIQKLKVKYKLESLQVLGYAPVFNEIRIYPGLDTDWMCSPVELDPLFHYYGNRLPMPKVIKREIDRMVAAGIDFRTFIAHELPGRVTASMKSIPVDWVKPPVPKALARRIHTLDRVGSLWRQAVQQTVKAVTVVGLATASAVAAPFVAAPLALTAGLDPIILGCHYDSSHKVNGHPIGLWYMVAQWYWPEEEI